MQVPVVFSPSTTARDVIYTDTEGTYATSAKRNITVSTWFTSEIAQEPRLAVVLGEPFSRERV
ncbi:hypothetical protein PC119_g28445 [Phytophthora cactorum]|nr:hypothetical protein PC119_g28445 [Phytophthora cactorum]